MIKVGDTAEVVEVISNDYYYFLPIIGKQFIVSPHTSDSYILTTNGLPLLMHKNEIKLIGKLKIRRVK